MLKRVLNEVSKFDYYFKEADDDEEEGVSVKVAPRNNRGTDYNSDDYDGNNVNAAPRSNRGTDYTKDDDEGNDEPDTGDDATDYTADDSEEPSDDNDTDNTGDNPLENDTGNETPAEDDDTGNEPDTGDDEATDYSSGGDGNQVSSDEGNGEENQDDDSQSTSPDERKRYSLYLRYLKLYNMIDSFSEKIRAVVKDDPMQNAVLNKVVENMSDLHDTMYEYMTIKFSTASYVESVIFYETVINCVRLNFELIRNNKINLKQ